jgi:putative nucleotidyltransferase with HDIG domain
MDKIGDSEKKALRALHASERQYQSLFESMLDGYALCRMLYDDNGEPSDWVYLDVNPAFERLTGLTGVIDRPVSEVIPGVLQTNPELLEYYGRAAVTGERQRFETFVPALGIWFSVSVFSPRKHHFVAVFENISERKHTQWEAERTVEFLALLNESNESVDLIHSAITFLQRHTGCEAVGVRLRDGDDYPYFEARGFPAEFVLAENELCLRADNGTYALDDEFSPVLACMCGNVIGGRFDPAKPFFTELGSFWSNCTTELLANTTDEDRLARTRNRCNGEGYESVALIPLSAGKTPLGLVQLNDRREGMFTAEKIAHWERLAGYLAVAVAKVRSEEAGRDLTARLECMLGATVDALSTTTETRDPYTAGHQRRVAQLACAIAAKLGWDTEHIGTLRTAAHLHDIGKISVPAELLTKPSRLSEIEFSIIKQHPQVAHDILAPIDFGFPVAEIVVQHHERLDGSGYPFGLQGADIRPGALILAVADVVEAMISHRPYRPALTLEAAMAEVREGAGKRYDESVCRACVELFEVEGFELTL